jgi:hypothetical protein
LADRLGQAAAADRGWVEPDMVEARGAVAASVEGVVVAGLEVSEGDPLGGAARAEVGEMRRIEESKIHG